eukprot:GILI01001344.1.p1 GENE.GILI01001344.1~~GILI01001344.1.p1  ORF type:complete len:541 (-),score=183.02 GILI01001344.1:137-1759(-)
MMLSGSPFGGLLKEGAKHLSGLEEAIIKNIEACKQLSQITRTSLGPNGMNKMVINHLDKLFITSDAATIVKELEVMHPAAKLLVMAAKMQEQEVGDATNLVVVLGGELLVQADALIRMGLHPSEIVVGYEKAAKKIYELLETNVAYTVTNVRDREQLSKGIKTSIASKQYGYEDFLSGLVADAAISVMPRDPKNFNIDNVRVAKILGGSILDTRTVHGVVVTRDAEGSVKKVNNAKIAVFGCPFEGPSTETKGTVLLHSAAELMSFTKGEEDSMEKTIKSIADAGVNVAVVGGSISEIAMHFFEKYRILVVKILSKFEIRRLSRAVGAVAMIRVGAPTAEELGQADEVSVQEIGSQRCVVFRRDSEDSKVVTLVLRGSTHNLLDDMERSIDDAVNTVKTLAKDGRLVPGAAATEIELSMQLQNFATTSPGLDQYAISRFAEALEVVPRTLAENAGLTATTILSALYAAHHNGEKNIGIDIENGGVKDVAADGVLDLVGAKLSAFKLAVDAAVTVLRVDQIIMAKPAGGPRPGNAPQMDDD